MGRLSENTFTIFTTHKMLDTLLPFFPEPYTTAPTQRVEHRTGYDARVAGLKTALFQFKRSGPRFGRWNYHLDPQQYWTFRAYCGSRQKGFYVLPIIYSEADLQSALAKGEFFKRIVYIDVFDVPPWTDGVEFTGADWFARGYPGAPLDYYTWDEVRAGLESCEVGLVPLHREPNRDEMVLTQAGNSVLARLRRFRELAREINQSVAHPAPTTPHDLIERVASGLLSLCAVEPDEDPTRAKEWLRGIFREDFQESRRMSLSNWGFYEARILNLPIQAPPA